MSDVKVTSKQRHDLKRLIKELSPHRGRHTELVTVYVPAGYELSKIIQHLGDEQGTATNIKSTATRKNVIDALEKMIQKLKLIGKTPPNGLAVFSGNVAEKEGQSDVKVWAYEPPLPLNLRLYRCDKDFKLQTLQDMVESKDVFGMVVLDRRDAIFALLKGKKIVPLTKTHSEVPGKFRAGGQSAQRFARLREEANKDHLKKVAAYMKDQFLSIKGDLKGILIGGPSVTTNDFMNRGYLTGDLQKKIIAVKDLSYTGEFGLQELLERSADVLASEEVAEEKAIMNKFLTSLAKDYTKVTYGENEVRKAIELGAVETVLVSEDVDDEKIEEFEELAKTQGSDVMIISTETREGVQLKDFGKIAALLRFDISSMI